ncbi:hypothetical protein PVAP13_3NG227415 [Panicum virgatum]|uniref:Uncharacterized protein n=1 Tax=Panicum virgatum TaxID=38727 RepID=A0A8T0UAA1_PANVG|nr:hypothetical protein PVAP13_3NG227415 [Panicum virgatum]
MELNFIAARVLYVLMHNFILIAGYYWMQAKKECAVAGGTESYILGLQHPVQWCSVSFW